MNVGCVNCNWRKDVPKRTTGVRAFYKCHLCRRPVTSISVFDWAEWIEAYADRFEVDRKAGRLQTRRQSTRESDRDISAAGAGAELAACLLLAPWRLNQWLRGTEDSKENRGRDFPAAWFADGRPVEVKYTHYRGHLLVRPPRNTPGRMSTEYIEDSLYVLLIGTPYTYTAVGWAGRSDLLKRGKRNPVPVRGRQRECWGIHADELNAMDRLFPLLSTPREERGKQRSAVTSPK